jgi:hypothetical protein
MVWRWGIIRKAIRKLLMVRGAGEWPVQSALTSPVYFPMTLPCGEPSPALLTTCLNHAYINLHAEPEIAR